MRFAILALTLLLASCGSGPDPKAAMEAMTAESLLAHTRKLSRDELEGRAPGTSGEELTVKYLAEEFRKLGLEPGAPDGTYYQTVPLMGITSRVTPALTAGGRPLPLTPGKDFIGVSRPQVETTQVKDSDVIFVGYGVQAPEYSWDDFKDVDVKGKTLLFLINDPPLADERMFKGKAMTYYGRWTYKYEIASQKGAAAAIIIHETGPAGYPFEVVTGSWGRENFDLQRPDGNKNRVPVEGWISLDKAKELLKAAGRDFNALKQQAATAEFRPVPLTARANFEVSNAIRKVESRNVVARLRAASTDMIDETIVYTAHWDHLGKDANREGDQIFNGALDNASGTAALLELAKAFSKLEPRPKRSIVFLAVTAEEKGLLGAKHYAENPIYPLKTTLANINMDGVNPWGKTKDIVVVGMGQSTLEDVLAEAAKDHGRTLAADPEPEKGYYYRSDHFEFAKVGVPALYTDSGDEYLDKPAGYGKKKRDEYTANDYHKVSDEVKPDWDLSGAIEDLKLLFEVGYRVSQAERFPQWKPGSEFKATRDKMVKD
ncbi:MAG: M20/M25/M40 family metallo-hydrolase [Acidimicrobiia bacterium]|nr:M20/M25/M40 family metallo-hydrolase [Acidimicrobiia bacterium]